MAKTYDGNDSRTKHPFRNFIVHAWATRFALTESHPYRISDAMCWQLCRCRSDEARRIILGVSR